MTGGLSWGERADGALARLVESIRGFSTRGIVLESLTETIYGQAVDTEQADLTSPGAQLHYLLGLMTRIPYRPGPPPRWNATIHLLNAYFDATRVEYDTQAKQLLPGSDSILANALFVREYYHRRFWSEREAIKEAAALFGEFKTEVAQGMGAEPEQLGEFGVWLRAWLVEQTARVRRELPALENRWEVEALIATSWSNASRKPFALELRRRQMELILGSRLMTPAMAEARFPGFGGRLLRELSIQRTSVDGEIFQLGDPNPLDTRPFIEVAPDVFYVQQMCEYWGAIMLGMEQSVRKSGAAKDYFTRRDDRLEARTRDVAQAIFRNEARVLSPAFSWLDGVRAEQDVVVLWRDWIVVFECKASTPPRASWQPEAASTLITKWFASKKGPQRGFEQANRIREIARKGPVRLTAPDSEELVLSVEPGRVSRICVLSESVGFLSVQPHWALPGADPKEAPWVVSISDLETFASGLAYFGDGPEAFIQYVEERALVADSVITFDELDVAAEFLRWRSIHHLLSEGLVVLPLDSANLFDEIEAARMGGPRAVRPSESRLAQAPRPSEEIGRKKRQAYQRKRRSFWRA